jgi:Tol biopolymer transport system component
MTRGAAIVAAALVVVSTASASEIDVKGYLAARGGTKPGIFLLRLPDRSQVRLTSGNDTSPTWSPDGMQLAFERRRGGQRSDIFLLRIGRNGARAAALPLLRGGGDPAWSPRGDRLAYVRHDGLFILDLSRRSTTRVVKSPLIANPSWAPTSDRLVFAALGRGLFAVKAFADGGLTRITSGSRDGEPAWSSSGTIAFSRAAITPDTLRANIYGVRADGRAPSLLVGGPGFKAEPSWSAVGLVFTRANPQPSLALTRATSEIYMRVAGRLTRLTSNRVSDASPAWRP